MEINDKRLESLFDEIKQFNDTPEIGYTRRVFSSTEEQSLSWFEKILKENNLYSHTDEVGNVFGQYGEGDNPILIGSHLDTVQNGGLYDGALGVLSGLEVLLTLKENNIKLNHPIMLVAFRGEEANILGGTFGSRVFAGIFDEKNDDLEKVGLSKEAILNSRNQQNFQSYIELHIEQGQVLENENLDIGIVTSIAGLRRYRIEVEGRSGHSGTTPMHLREDALKHATAELQKIFEFSGALDDQSVLTVGKLNMYPNQANVIPNKVEMLVEIRSDVEDKLNQYEETLLNMIASKNERVVKKHTTKLDEQNITKLSEVTKKLGYTSKKMASGANHDANSVSTIMPASMIFIPSKNGISHHPDEYSSKEQIVKGSNVLLNYILES
ncbi:M20 family metallo-hydrolase [Mammaliicoccus sciuri]|uniref:M20 family metallo-hydrolase n=1 Tax=Mammaliicoccus sciuri TaxID=1296 RepID=UPI00194FD0FB|nr:M20 family metallo-hydrolase [Mammaliicoccus sciuri]MCD8837751.1 M20 family metallo-hydrolase [Mammaliicoccus sciuri]MCJ0940910.1 M20 family metallo-hydrolase [Mammaliicoccus sciuri]MCJ0965042.1 M20 family metallo-hydrolase [Mammaliicoccus sciuri]MEB6225661.1 M20 family metallo-hydrolase [Mammaliicoccus sciuri]MEB7408375.1 M20 family metallo-hydrolase [Mammaliicoccus sciuri]